MTAKEKAIKFIQDELATRLMHLPVTTLVVGTVEDGFDVNLTARIQVQDYPLFETVVYDSAWSQEHNRGMSMSQYVIQTILSNFNTFIASNSIAERGDTQMQTQRPPFVLNTPNGTNEFIRDLEYFVNDMKSHGVTEKRLNQIKALAESELEGLTKKTGRGFTA